MFGLGPTELIIIGVIVLLIFGAKRLPSIGKGLGGAVKEFKGIKKELELNNKEESDGSEQKQDSKNSSSIEGEIAERVLGQVPGVKKVMSVNKKIKKVKEIIK
jgi:sec-independent protein translocase protein TatA